MCKKQYSVVVYKNVYSNIDFILYSRILQYAKLHREGKEQSDYANNMACNFVCSFAKFHWTYVVNNHKPDHRLVTSPQVLLDLEAMRLKICAYYLPVMSSHLPQAGLQSSNIPPIWKMLLYKSSTNPHIARWGLKGIDRPKIFFSS